MPPTMMNGVVSAGIDRKIAHHMSRQLSFG
jgi:hypothetical protein